MYYYPKSLENVCVPQGHTTRATLGGKWQPYLWTYSYTSSSWFLSMPITNTFHAHQQLTFTHFIWELHFIQILCHKFLFTSEKIPPKYSEIDTGICKDQVSKWFAKYNWVMRDTGNKVTVNDQATEGTTARNSACEHSLNAWRRF